MESKYNPTDIESRWYQYWLDNRLFHSEPDGRQPFTVVIPPPNVTGVLHMGHVLNETIQDILVRRARLEGKNACWVPGTDHASIATEAKVIKRLKEQGINKSGLTREQFLKHAWDWTDEHGGIILKQLRKLGCSCDWDRTSFTMDETRSKAVISVFCDLYRKGLIYRGLRMVNWDPERQTALSDEEVIYHEEHSHLYYLKYEVVEEPGKYCVVATTRPETIFGDIAVCINPKEEKNQWLKGKHVRVPLVGREIPIIEDRYVEIGFGTGCLKVTPAHDVNDYMLGQKYNLPAYDIFTPDAHLDFSGLEPEIAANCAAYQGMDRFVCRKQIAKDLDAARLMEKAMKEENMSYCLHLGVTEAGEGIEARLKSASGICPLLSDGIGDTIRVSLTEDPENEIPVGEYIADRCAGRDSSAKVSDHERYILDAAIENGPKLFNGEIDTIELEDKYLEAEILQACRKRFYKPEYIACPGCGRTLYDLEGTFAEVKKRTSHLKGLRIAVMGCIVNGPGEMADADYGYVGAGRDCVSLYRGKECVLKNIPQEQAVEQLINLIRSDMQITNYK